MSGISSLPGGFTALIPAPRRIFGQRIFLQRLTKKHSKAAHELICQNRFWLKPWMPEVPDGFSIQNAERIIRLESNEARRAQRLDLGIFDSESRALIGKISIHSIRWGIQHSGGLGYWIDQDFACQGRMKEAVATTVSLAFGELFFHRVWAGVNPSNVASKKLLEALGFQMEGIHRKELFIDGHWQDQCHYSILAEEYPVRAREWKKRGWLGSFPDPQA